MSRVISVLTLLLIFLGVSAASPGDVVDRCASTLNASPSVTVDFTIVGEDGNEIPSTLIVSKDNFRLSSPGMETWYDGKNQWTYFSENKQLSISEPTPEELLESNPLAVVNNWKKLYTAVSTGRANEVRLDARRKTTTVKSVQMTADPKTSLPKKLLVTFSNGNQVSVFVKNIRKGKAVPASTFKYDKKRYPAKETVDLR